MKHLFIVGAQRCGTTYLYHMLDGHPQINMARPVRPEPKFFMRNELVEFGRDYYEQVYFSNLKPRACYLGEKSTSYLESLEVAQRIKRFYPDARILVMLRDPVFRAYSNYRFSMMNDLERLTFAEALAAEPERLKSATFDTSVTPYAYRKRGHYMDYIDTWLKVFDPTQLCILIFEEFANDLASVQNLYGWLGVEQCFVPPLLKEVINPAAIKTENSKEAFRDLALGYRESIERLEIFLGRRVQAWSNREQSIYYRFQR